MADTREPDRRTLALAVEIGARALAKGNYGTGEGWRDWVDDARLVVLAVAPTLTRTREVRSCG